MLFVGDSRNDILAAHSAGCPVVGLTYGYNYNIPIAESNPDWVFDDLAQFYQQKQINNEPIKHGQRKWALIWWEV